MQRTGTEQIRRDLQMKRRRRRAVGIELIQKGLPMMCCRKKIAVAGTKQTSLQTKRRRKEMVGIGMIRKGLLMSCCRG